MLFSTEVHNRMIFMENWKNDKRNWCGLFKGANYTGIPTRKSKENNITVDSWFTIKDSNQVASN
jgi:hypothetical protein